MTQNMNDYDYPNLRRVTYWLGDSALVFIPVCPVCGRFVKSDDSVMTDKFSEEYVRGDNATCAKHGRKDLGL